jgi:flagellar basal-body rod protein FlgB
MIDSIFSNPTLRSLQQSVEFTERRHSILAGNIANMDTPGYKTRDLSVDNFQQSLKSLISAEGETGSNSMSRLAALSPGNPKYSQYGETADISNKQAIEQVRDSMKQVVYQDGSDDSLEMQVTQIAKNQSMHSMAIALMKSQFKMLQMAISESMNV